MWLKALGERTSFSSSLLQQYQIFFNWEI